MIIDRTRLAGDAAYLTDEGAINLALSQNHTGELEVKMRGMGIDVSGVRLLLRMRDQDLRSLYARSDVDGEPILSFFVTKELFPEFFADPYAHRVHTVAGFEDFQRGRSVNLRAMEVEGKATLVALDWGDCAWESPVYNLSEPMTLASAAWELASARLTPDDSFHYALGLQTWTANQDPAVDTPNGVELVSAPAKPSDLRHRTGLNLDDVIAYRVVFKAQVKRDSDLLEVQFVGDGLQGGRPLLRAVHLLEPVQSPYVFSCLHELASQCNEFSFLEPSLPLETLSVYVELPALLVHRESIRVAVQAGLWDVVEAQLDGEIRVRPPLVNRVLGD